MLRYLKYQGFLGYGMFTLVSCHIIFTVEFQQAFSYP